MKKEGVIVDCVARRGSLVAEKQVGHLPRGGVDFLLLGVFLLKSRRCLRIKRCRVSVSMLVRLFGICVFVCIHF